ncbi:hypothetical protein QYE76_069736 [Lolium multiflorum]|uniref:CCHC-type domain-containing protein n=1 Tax=Lolium multiflorum TaxID=4521 RepID=A0AAD8WCY4_LOLMU|nr:hypothetical protein QYE76_069736 [Lolium multiflorum]
MKLQDRRGDEVGPQGGDTPGARPGPWRAPVVWAPRAFDLPFRLLKASVAKPPVREPRYGKPSRDAAVANPISGDSGDRLRHPAGRIITGGALHHHARLRIDAGDDQEGSASDDPAPEVATPPEGGFVLVEPVMTMPTVLTGGGPGAGRVEPLAKGVVPRESSEVDIGGLPSVETGGLPGADMASSINFNQFLEKEKLKSNGSNFTDWFRHVRIFLNGGNLQYVLDAPLGDPPAETETDEVKNVYMTRKTRYSQVQCAILCSLESDLQKRFEHHDPHELIKELKTIFETHAAVECYEASKHFFSCMMEEGSSISEHMLVMTGHAKKLSDLGIVIPNRLGINRVLQSLPPSYKNFVMNYNMQNMNKEFPELFGMLKAAEIEIKKEHQVLMVNKTTSFKKQGKSKGKNKKSGKKAATPPVKPKSGPKPDAECYYCKEKGHWKRNCSKYLADLKSGLIKKKKEGMEHWTAVKNILKYLKRTKDMFLCYGGDQELVVTSYTDASWNTDPDDSKSQSGYVFILNGAAVSWASSKQCTVAKSSTESEYIAASEASEAVWMKRFIVELGVVPSALDPFVIYCDNMGAIANAQEPRSHKRLKHIKLRYHSIREYIEDGEVKICKVHTDLNVADPLTKALPRAKHDQHQNAMGVRYITM